MVKISCWNVNGIRAAAQKGLFDWMLASNADLICLQETKAHPDQLGQEFLTVGPYRPLWASAQKRGYSGVAIYAKTAPLAHRLMDVTPFDAEGRVLVVTYPSFTLFNCYFPNSQEAGARLPYKLSFCQELKRQADTLVAAGRSVVICGDYNIAHKPIDLAHPKQNEENPGYLPEERAWMDEFTAAGYIDTFRSLHPEPQRYSWWSYRLNARDRNVGWRIDYFCTSPDLASRVQAADIEDQIYGSDHCPVNLQLEGSL
jgi:exodeoxyribonuclease-3